MLTVLLTPEETCVRINPVAVVAIVARWLSLASVFTMAIAARGVVASRVIDSTGKFGSAIQSQGLGPALRNNV